MKSSGITTAESTQVLENTELNLLENKAFKILKKIKNFIPDNNSLYTKLVQHCVTVGKNEVYYKSLDKLLFEEIPDINSKPNGLNLYQELHKLMRLLCFEDTSINYDYDKMDETRERLENYIIENYNILDDNFSPLIGEEIDE